ncbi:MAG TPA: tRNA pseudouridine(38-40) synthase TruA [Bacteroidales bacterium]|nr:tRNA pseudouridine(38-40) synthase TruA [Bacteroidales bacterium]
MPQRYFIKLSYDGSRYHGWQQQDNAMSIEHKLNVALNTILRQEVKITGCGRTDAGVHAKEFYAHFDAEQAVEAGEKMVYNLNSLLPDDIVIDNIFKVKPEAHARFSATKRTYRYFINSKRNPFSKDYEYFFFRKLDMGLMNEACNILIEHKDFSCFSKTHTQVNNFFCTIYEARWETQDSRYIFTITANRFLRNMVRAIVGTMLDVGLHKISLEEFRKIIEKGSRSEAGMSVAAKGLFLTKVEYPPQLFENIE